MAQSKGMMNIVMGVLIFTSLIGTIATNVTTAQNNVSGTGGTLLALITIVLIIGFVTYVWKGSQKGF